MEVLTAADTPPGSPLGSGGESMAAGNLRLDLAGYRAFVGERSVALSYQEFELLRLLVAQPDRILSYHELIERLWSEGSTAARRRLSVVVCRLRAKLAGSRPYGIRTVRGRGYGLTAVG